MKRYVLLVLLALLVTVSVPVSKIYAFGTPILDSQFKVLINTYSVAEDSQIISTLKPYLKDGDIINVVHGNNQNPVDLTVLNSRLDNLKAGLTGKKLIYTVLYSGLDKGLQIASGLSPSKASYLFYDYEPNFEPEFTKDFSASLTNIAQSATNARNYGFNAGTAPTGRGLFDAGFASYNWNYGQIANKVDMQIVQTQSTLNKDYLNSDLTIPNNKNYLNKLVTQLAGAGTTIEVYPQVTLLSNSNPNGVPLDYAIAGRHAIRDDGFQGASIWWGSDAINDVLSLLQEFRTAS